MCIRLSEGCELTRKEFDCLSLMVNGYNAKKASRVLNNAHNTVYTHLRSIHRKTNCTSRSCLVDYVDMVGAREKCFHNFQALISQGSAGQLSNQ